MIIDHKYCKKIFNVNLFGKTCKLLLTLVCATNTPAIGRNATSANICKLSDESIIRNRVGNIAKKLTKGVTSTSSLWPKINPKLYVIASQFPKLRRCRRVCYCRVNITGFDHGSKKFKKEWLNEPFPPKHNGEITCDGYSKSPFSFTCQVVYCRHVRITRVNHEKTGFY